jgi:hypothetical protein
MAITINVADTAIIKVGTGSQGALEELGRTRNGADLTFEGFFLDVPGDDHGGDDGHPIDIQYLGEIARVRLELTKWDASIADKVRPRRNGRAFGRVTGHGELMIQDGLYYRLLIDCANLPKNFPCAFPRTPIELNKGTKFSILVVEFECHPLAGTLWNRDTSATGEESESWSSPSL